MFLEVYFSDVTACSLLFRTLSYLLWLRMMTKALPPWYNKLNDLKGCPIEQVVLTNDQAAEWTVVVKPTTTGYCMSIGWSVVVGDLDVEEKDFIVFQVVDANTFKITHFKSDQLSEVNKFCHVMLFPQNKNLWLPKSFMERYFKTDTLDIEFTIRFGTGDFIVFELVANHLFNILLFCPHGFQFVILEVALSVTVDEQEHSGDMDLIEDDEVAKDGEHLDTVDVVFEGEDLDEDQVANKHDLDHDVVNVPPDVPVVEAEAVLEHEVLDDIPIPPFVAQPDDFELIWHLTFHFRFPKAFATNVDLSVLNEMTVETEDGFSMTLEMWKETTRGRIRYALRGWENFMLAAGLENGG